MYRIYTYRMRTEGDSKNWKLQRERDRDKDRGDYVIERGEKRVLIVRKV